MITEEIYLEAKKIVDTYESEQLNKHIVSGSLPDFEYEMFFKSEPDDFCKIDGWYPIATDRIKKPERIEKYIENGLLRKIRK